MVLLRGLAGALSFVGALAWVGIVGLPWILTLQLVVPLRPARRLPWISTWARAMSGGVLTLLRLGGARYRRVGAVPSAEPGIVVMNHQSVLDIPTIILMCRPWTPAFVTRKRYAQAPVIGRGLALADCPVIDPREDREGAVATMRAAAARDRMYLVYPEGHRTHDGLVQPFRAAGLRAMLEERRLPVWLVATDGFCPGRNLVDFVLHVHEIDGHTEVMGRYEPPADAAELDAFLERLQSELAARVVAMRAARAAS